jgi:hypothetical protein
VSEPFLLLLWFPESLWSGNWRALEKGKKIREDGEEQEREKERKEGRRGKGGAKNGLVMYEELPQRGDLVELWRSEV